MRQHKRPLGYTLIELMIVVAVVAILAAFAYPSYNEYVLKSRRSDAKAALLNASLAEEKWRANNTSYTSNLASLGLTASSPDEHYTIAISNVSGTTYTITASPQGVQTADTDCPSLTLDQNGTQGGNADCW